LPPERNVSRRSLVNGILYVLTTRPFYPFARGVHPGPNAEDTIMGVRLSAIAATSAGRGRNRRTYGPGLRSKKPGTKKAGYDSPVGPAGLGFLPVAANGYSLSGMKVSSQ
jgi:hypothetical protein